MRLDGHVRPVSDEDVKTICPQAGTEFGDDCSTFCYDGYCPLAGCPDAAVVYTCADKAGSTTGQWLPGTNGTASGVSDNRHCTGNPCDEAPPQSAGGTPVADATTCAATAHYDRRSPVECNHGDPTTATTADEPCIPGYNYNGHLGGTHEWTECASLAPFRPDLRISTG